MTILQSCLHLPLSAPPSPLSPSAYMLVPLLLLSPPPISPSPQECPAGGKYSRPIKKESKQTTISFLLTRRMVDSSPANYPSLWNGQLRLLLEVFFNEPSTWKLIIYWHEAAQPPVHTDTELSSNISHMQQRQIIVCTLELKVHFVFFLVGPRSDPHTLYIYIYTRYIY